MAECPSLGAVKGRYLAVAKGENTQQNDSDNEETELLDKNGVKIQKSGEKEEVIRSSDGVKNIKAMWGQQTWQKSNTEDDRKNVDSQSVNSARNVFKNFDQNKSEEQKSFNRPTTKKRDAKELMEQRKKATYGEDEEIQDGVVKKSVVIDESEIASSNRQEALNKYKQLESSPADQGDLPKNRPTNRLLSDNDASAMMAERTDSVSSSEHGDITVDVGYEGSVSPCSPTSEMSDDYISDTPKDEKVLNDSAFEETSEEVPAGGEE